jgi:hypothetical protein
MSDTPGDDGQEYPLADMLARLGRELEAANARAIQSGRPGRLRWTEATVELGVTWEKTGDGGIDLKVVRLGGGLTKANTTTISVRVVPYDGGPLDQHGGPLDQLRQDAVYQRYQDPADHPPPDPRRPSTPPMR